MTSIQIVKWEKIDTSKYKKLFKWDIYIIHVRISDVDIVATKMINDIQTNTWINDLDLIDQQAYSERMKPTINKLVKDIYEKVDWEVTTDFWEYLVSHSAWNALNKVFSHTIIPLAELWKEQISWNPWFDFHTETLSELIAFWEAKYRSSWNSYTEALTQINDFINKKKDIKELSDLKKITTNNASKNAALWKKSYVAAFSINWIQYDKIFDNILNSDHIDPLLIYPEIYLIWVEVSK